MKTKQMLTSPDDVREFLEAHAGEILGLYQDTWYRNGGWNGQIGALAVVEKRYKVEISTEGWKDGEFEELMAEVLNETD